MHLPAILYAALAATSAMTLFSYILSWASHKCFKEPELLKPTVAALLGLKNEFGKFIAAWTIHYGIGLLFVTAYHFIWRHTVLQPDYLCGLGFGILSGIIAVIAWSFLLRIPDDRPKVNKPAYYIQLIAAHVIFAIVAVFVYNTSR